MQKTTDKTTNELKEKYNFEQLEEEVMKILRKVDGGGRLSTDELIWLKSIWKEDYIRELKEGHHRNEARFYAGQYNKTKNYWAAVTASGHYRKCSEPATADSMLKTIDVSGLKDKKLKSALFTTHGGVKRDLGQKDEALNLGEQAHLLTPQDFRPCTLLGAVNYDIGNYALGDDWFEKAIERGYDPNSIDNELKRIFRCANKSEKKALRDHLLTKDPIRYSWAIDHYDLGDWFEKAIERGYDPNSIDNELRSIFMRANESEKKALRDYLLTKDPIRYSWAKKTGGHRRSQKSKKSNKK